MCKSVWCWCAVLIALVPSAAELVTQDQFPTKEGVAQRFDQPHFSPYAGRSYPTKVLWGGCRHMNESRLSSG